MNAIDMMILIGGIVVLVVVGGIGLYLASHTPEPEREGAPAWGWEEDQPPKRPNGP